MNWLEKVLQEATELVVQAMDLFEDLRDEQQEKMDNLPERKKLC